MNPPQQPTHINNDHPQHTSQQPRATTHHQPQPVATNHKPYADLTHETKQTDLTHKTQQTNPNPQPTHRS